MNSTTTTDTTNDRKTKLAFIIDAPPSDNRRLIPARNRWVLSSEYRAWQNAALITVRAAANQAAWRSTSTDCVVSAWLNLDRRRDIQNCAKGICDVLEKGGVYDDDRQVSQLRLYRGGDEGGLSRGQVLVVVAVIR